jgi:uncharacterized protein (TIGR00255 family)
MRSMTGFGQGSATGSRHQVSVALRSVNARFLDLVLRVREEHRALEAPLRAALEEELARGRVEATVEVKLLQPPALRVSVQAEVVRALAEAGRELAAQGLAHPDLSLADLLRIPEVVTLQADADEPQPEDAAVALSATRAALAQLVAAREQEGAQLRRILGERIAALRAAAEQLRARAPVARQEIHANLRRRVQDLLAGAGVDEARLAQEVALLVDKSDVLEELDRLGAHLVHFGELLDTGGALGKRLDFLSQEILRELNTLGSKCRDGEMARTVLDAKVVCEQLREQVQNVE